ncbi:sialoadhesin-like isoform X2 [Sceloporus undulatus]|uniref:sialoadhesin-like isoform X2 n=1 Tax=Sceloporus undulatus TaxID=8520 RepID=UPI001C4B852C|nr:sialoadhesin-like isoform X2 [Sceloporus undulatus]
MSAYLDNQNGRVGIISCQVDSHPRSRMALYKGGQLVASTNSSRLTTGRRFIVFSSYNSLRVEIQDIKAGDSGHYVCQVGNQLGDAASVIDFRAERLSNLRLFKILAGIFIALVAVAVLSGLVFGMKKYYPRISEGFQRCKEWKRKNNGSEEMETREETVQKQPVEL